MSFHPYLFFSSGRCADAFAFYQETLGGDLEIMTTADLPEDATAMPGAEAHHVMHASLKLGQGLLMGSDDPAADGPRGGMAVSYDAGDTTEGQRVFEALAEDGEILMAYGPTFFSEGFGVCVDRFGVDWMIYTDTEPTA